LKMKNLLLLLFLLGCTISEMKDTGYDPVKNYLRSIISNDDNVGIKKFSSFSDSTIYEVEALYLGQMKQTGGESYKIMNVTYYTGILEDAKRARGEILVYNYENDLIGRYGVGGITRLPTEIKGEEVLWFYPKGKCTEKTNINFSKGPPDKIYIKCTSKGGDLFDFEKI
jgi:hypothetical protein